MFITKENFIYDITPNGISRIKKGSIDSLMLTELHWKKDQQGSPHSHPEDQCNYVIEGAFEATIGNQKQIVEKGDCLYIKGNTPHYLKALQDNSIILDIFSPKRNL